MTDNEIIEKAIRNVANEASGNPLGYWFLKMADEIKAVREEYLGQIAKDPEAAVRDLTEAELNIIRNAVGKLKDD